jgi:sugar-specific transcriptional regulator TrmB
MSRSGSGLLELLTEHGVPEKGARLYLAACRGGPQTASELARLSAIGRVEAYRIIKQLEADGMLTATGTRPRRFAALPPAQLVDRWIQRASERVRQLESGRPKILADWEAERTDLDDRDPRKFAVLDGREAIRSFLRKRVGTAERQIFVSASGPLLTSLIEGGIDRSFREAVGRGVKVKMVTEVFSTNLAQAKHFASFSELRHTGGPLSNRTVVIDRAGALVTVSGEDGDDPSEDDEVALWSTAPEFVRRVRAHNRRIWMASLKAENRFVELENPPSAILPVVGGREAVPFQRLKEIAKLGMRASGVREFELPLPEMIETIARQLGREIAEEVAGETVEEVARSLSRFYATHTMGHLGVVKDDPLTLRVTGCFACTSDSPEIGRVMCPQLFRAVLESRLGGRWDVSKPDPTKHAVRGCVFTATAA